MRNSLFAILLILVFVTGCSQSAILEKRVAETEKRLENLGIDVSDNTMKIDKLQPGSQISSTPESEIRPDEVGRLTDRIERLERQIVDLQREIRTMKSKEADVYTRFSQPDPEPETEPEQPAAKPQVERREEPVASQVEKQYNAARELYMKRKYDAAILSFQQMIGDYPTHDLAANAQYWIGECYYDRDSFIKAIDEFQKVIDFYPTSKKAPDAQLKVGLCYKQLGKVDQAKLEIKRIEKMYPNYERKALIDKILEDMK